jgi:hypothetical protein
MWHLKCDAAQRKWILSTLFTPGGGGSATYELGFDDWDCLGANEMVLASSTPHCVNWPATVTLTPAA